MTSAKDFSQVVEKDIAALSPVAREEPEDTSNKLPHASLVFPCVVPTGGHDILVNLSPFESISTIKEFFECHLEDVLDKSLLSCNIQYTVILVSEASLPNLAYHKMVINRLCFSDTCFEYIPTLPSSVRVGPATPTLTSELFLDKLICDEYDIFNGYFRSVHISLAQVDRWISILPWNP